MRPESRHLPVLALALLAAFSPRPASAEEVLVAVAANFTEAIEAIGRDFEAASGHRLTVATGSTGTLYAQIANGAPFDVFLAADQARPIRLAEVGLGVPETRFT